MKFLAALTAVTAALGTTAEAKRSRAFQLVIQSNDASTNGRSLVHCGFIGNVYGMCLGSKFNRNNRNTEVIYHWNTTSETPYTGLLVHSQEINPGRVTVPGSMTLTQNPPSKIAIALFGANGEGNGQNVVFDKNGRMGLQDLVGDANQDTRPSKYPAYQRWFICKGDKSYGNRALFWAWGAGSPQSRSCSKVAVVRKFV